MSSQSHTTTDSGAASDSAFSPSSSPISTPSFAEWNAYVAIISRTDSVIQPSTTARALTSLGGR
eukprot:6386039-Alexandrium_andersonii.AAC.1